MEINHLAFILLISGISGNPLQGIEFTSRASTGVQLTVEPGFDFSRGFTTCLRAMLTFIDLTSLFDSPKSVAFELDPYWLQTGVVRVSDINYHFQWPIQQVNLEPYHWYTFCIVYDVSINVVSIPSTFYEQLLHPQITKAQKDTQVVSLFCAFGICTSKSCS